MNKRILSIILIFTMIFAFLPKVQLKTYADELSQETVVDQVYEKTVSEKVYEKDDKPYEGKKIKVRVEGKDSQLYEKEITVADEVYGIDLLKTAIGSENIVGHDTDYGFYIDGIKKDGKIETEEFQKDYSISWGLYIVENGALKSASTGISNLTLDSINELILHKKAMDTSWNDLTHIPKLEMIKKGNQTTFIVKKIVSIWGQPDQEKVVQKAELTINDKVYKTDEQGEVTIILPEGVYDISVSKQGAYYPELIRHTFKINLSYPKIRVRVEGKDKTLYDDTIKITNEITALDILNTAVGEENINGENSAYGLLIQEILGEVADFNTNGAYWGIYTVKNGETQTATEGVATLKINGLDEILFHVNKSTTLPIIEYQQDAKEQKIIIKTEMITYDENWNEKKIVKPVQGAKVKINDDIYITDEKGEIYTKLPEGEYIAEISKDEDGEYPELVKCIKKFFIGNKMIKIISDTDMLTVGKELKLTAKVLDQDNHEIENERVKWYTSNEEIATVDQTTGLVKGVHEGKVTISARIESNQNLSASIDLIVEEEKTNEQKIKEIIETLRKHYEMDSEFTLSEALGYKFTSEHIQNDLMMIQSKYKVKLQPSSASEYAKTIIGIITQGKDPKNFEGKNYVNDLIALQNNEGKFILSKWDDYPSVQAFSIIALDMANANYRVNDAVSALMSYQNEDGSFGAYKDMDTLAMSMMGLWKHKDLKGVKESIDKGVEKILAEKEVLIESANANTLAAVIQGLISVGENPLSEQWSVNKKTMLNALCKHQEGDTFGNELATEQVFTALADLYKRQSMFTGAQISSEGYDQLFIGSDDNHSDKDPIEEGDKVYISIKGYNYKTILSRTEVELKQKDTVFSVTKRVLEDQGISYEEENGYFKKIDEQGEFDQGAKSGWMYNVNGQTILESAQDCSVRDKDSIEWFYTNDYTNDSRNTNIKGSIEESIISKEIEQAKDILDNKNASESDMTQAVKDVTDKLNEKVNTINSESDAKKIVKDIKEFSAVIEKAMDRIITKKGAKSFADESVNMVKSLVKTSEKINQDSDKKEISKAAASNMKNLLKAMDKIQDTKEINKIAEDMLKTCASLIKKIGKENGEEIKEKALKIVEKAVDLASIQKVEKEQIKIEGEKAVASINAKKIKDLAANLIKTATQMQEILKKNDMENKEIKKKLVIAIAGTTKKEVEVNLPSNLMKIVKENGIEKVGVKTEVASFNLSSKTFGEKAQDKEMTLSAKEIDRNELLTLMTYKVPKDSVIVDLNAKVGEEKVSSFEEPIEITIPYKGIVEEGKDVKAFFLGDDGRIEKVGGVYDSVAKTVTFTTAHFSKYFAKQVEKGFIDLQGYNWAKEAIETMARKNIIRGRSEGKFDPATNITRAEFVTLVTKMLGYDDVEETLSFTDVKKDAWYYDAVKKAYKNGLINGRTDKIFDPEGNITRQEMAVVIAKVLKQKGYEKADLNNLDAFKDAGSIAPWAKEGVALTVKEKIITGMSKDVLAPREKANRAQGAVMLYKLYQLIMK